VGRALAARRRGPPLPAAQASGSKARFGGIEIGQVATRDALVADITGTTSMRRGDYGGVTRSCAAGSACWTSSRPARWTPTRSPTRKESGSFGTAAETAEGVAKPEAALTLTDDEAVAATIAHWLKIRKQALADVPALQSIIDGRLRYGVLRRLEGQVLNGDGVRREHARHPADLRARRRHVHRRRADRRPDPQGDHHGVPRRRRGDRRRAAPDRLADGAAREGRRATGQYFSGGPFEVTPQQMWGVPLIPSVAVAQGTALVGDFAIGAQLLIREGVQVLLSDNDGSTSREPRRRCSPRCAPRCRCSARRRSRPSRCSSRSPDGPAGTRTELGRALHLPPGIRAHLTSEGGSRMADQVIATETKIVHDPDLDIDRLVLARSRSPVPPTTLVAAFVASATADDVVAAAGSDKALAQRLLDAEKDAKNRKTAIEGLQKVIDA
jgi:hypothetical protein